MKDPNGSYVVQQLINSVPKIQKYFQESGKKQQEELAALEELVVSLSKV